MPPIAKKIPRVITTHGHSRTDDYFWLREKENPEVIKYLEDENKYTENVMDHTKGLQEKLFQEMKGRIKETDSSYPVKIDNYFYYVRTEEGLQYSIYCRKKDNINNPEEIILDQNELAKGKSYLRVSTMSVSPDHKKIAYSVDDNGAERYVMYTKNLETGDLYDETIQNTSYSLEWFNDNQTFLYVTYDEMRRPYKVWKHTLGEVPEQDILVHHEKDERFFVDLKKSRTKKYLFIELKSAITSEWMYLDADNTESKPTVIHPRQQGHEYYVGHWQDYFFIRTNAGAKNFRLVKTLVAKSEQSNWQEVLSHRDDVALEHFDVFKKFLVLYERKEGVTDLKIIDIELNSEHFILLPEKLHGIDVDSNPDFDSTSFRFEYSSLVTPDSVFNYEMDNKKLTLLKEYEVLGGYDKSQYVSSRAYGTAQDGTKIPISLLYKKGLEKNSKNPCYLYGYGSYGHVLSPQFSSVRTSLLDRGFVFAIAHIRGGEECGRDWYENGKYLKKKNTFTDFVVCAEHLISEGYTSKDIMSIVGGSAGGMLIGATINLRPDLFHTAVANVPFVDVVNTILDETLPLTVIEWEEWGNPNEKEYYDYMLSYSPYDNVIDQNYPNLLVTAGLNDPRVSYWEPAKWVTKLRALKTDMNTLILKTEMASGHGGSSGRYNKLKEIAFEYAFILDTFGIKS